MKNCISLKKLNLTDPTEREIWMQESQCISILNSFKYNFMDYITIIVHAY